MSEDDLNLSVGDFVYQSDQELFLVVIGETDNSYQFAVHGWRNIDKKRVDEYVSHENGKLHRQEDINDFISDEADEEEQEQFEKMKQMFNVYNELDLSEDGPHTEFSLEDTR